MKAVNRITAAATILAAAALAPVGSAQAGGLSIHFQAGHSHEYGQRHRSRQGYRTYGHRRSYAYRNHHRHGRSEHHYKRGRRCEPVHQRVTDEYGRTIKIGGTLCFGHDGVGYVLPGSRYVISRY